MKRTILILTAYAAIAGSAFAGSSKIPTPKETEVAERMVHEVLRAKADCIAMAVYCTDPTQLSNPALIKQICDLAFEDKGYAAQAYQMIIDDVRAAGWVLNE